MKWWCSRCGAPVDANPGGPLMACPKCGGLSRQSWPRSPYTWPPPNPPYNLRPPAAGSS